MVILMGDVFALLLSFCIAVIGTVDQLFYIDRCIRLVVVYDDLISKVGIQKNLIYFLCK